MNENLPSSARIVIIGGGIIGCSVAWHLTRLGVTDVLLIERHQLGSGTTWHSAGNITRLSESAPDLDLATYGASLYADFEKRGEHSVGWRNCGRVMLARCPDRVAQLERIVAACHAQGVGADFLSMAEVHEKLPIMHLDDIKSAIWSPGDGRVNPTDLLAAYAREARQGGARLVEGVAVGDVLIEHARVAGVVTPRGEVRCETVINCAGLWARDLGLRHGVDIPLYANEHFYLLTEPVEGVHRDMPTFRDPDGLIYGREEIGGLLLGCFDRNAKPIAANALPEDFAFGLLNEDWDQFDPYLREWLHRIPALQHTGVKMLLNGPESFTKDCCPIMGEAPTLAGYYVLAGMNSAGVQMSAGMGQVLANWVVAGDPGVDVDRFDILRFHPGDNDEACLRLAVSQAPSSHFG